MVPIFIAHREGADRHSDLAELEDTSECRVWEQDHKLDEVISNYNKKMIS